MIDKIISKMLKGTEINQNTFYEYMNSSLERAIKAGRPKEEIDEMWREMNSGRCPFCETKYKKIEIVNPMISYEYYIPDCKCLEKQELRREELARKRSRIQSACLPKLFISKESNKWDDSVDKKMVKVYQDIREYYLTGAWEQENGLILYGKVGTGKTHIGCLFLKWILQDTDKACLFVSASDLISNLINDKQYQDNLKHFDVLMIDDIDKMYTANSWIQERLYSITNMIINDQKQMFLTTNLDSLKEIQQKFEYAVASRLIGSCKAFHFEGEDYRRLRRIGELKKEKKC